MKLLLIRDQFHKDYTTGKLYIDGVFYCYTLENQDCFIDITNKKIPDTAIPAGTYKVIIDFSQRFQKMMPKLLNVPFFEGVRIHTGNTANDTEGCILVGTKRTEGHIWNSRAAFYLLFQKILKAIKMNETVKITIERKEVKNNGKLENNCIGDSCSSSNGTEAV